jgi:hypothetical protein
MPQFSVSYTRRRVGFRTGIFLMFANPLKKFQNIAKVAKTCSSANNRKFSNDLLTLSNLVQSYKTFFARNKVSYCVCPWQAFSGWYWYRP